MIARKRNSNLTLQVSGFHHTKERFCIAVSPPLEPSPDKELNKNVVAPGLLSVPERIYGNY